MADIRWIKITTDIFDDEKILLIESLPEADSIIVIWFKLLCLAGKMNNSGVFVLNDKMAYTDKMLATIFRRKESTVSLALKTFEQFGMIEIVDDVITIPNWGKHQNLDQLESKKEYMRTYMQQYRRKQAEIADKTNGKVNRKTNSKANVSSVDKDIDKEIEIEIEEEKKEREIYYAPAREEPLPPPIRRNPEPVKPAYPAEMTQCMDMWNGLQEYGIKPVLDIAGQRYMLLTEILQKHGMDGYSKAIDMVKASEFLQGKNDRGWKITFDWFVKQSNFSKVLEGNYANETETKDDAYLKMVEEWERKANGDKQRIYKA